MAGLAGLGFLALAWLIPNHFPPWTSVYNEASAALGLALLVLASVRHWRARLPNLAWVIFAVAAIPGLQFAAGLLHFSGDAWVSSAYVLGFGIAIGAGSFLARADAVKAATVLAVTILLGALLSSLVACLQTLRMEGQLAAFVYSADAALPGANLGQPNNLATLLSFGALSLLLLHEQGKLRPWLAATMLGVLLVGAALTQSRTSLLFGPTILLGLWVAKRRGTPMKTRLSMVALATLAHWLLVLAWPGLQESLLLSARESVAQSGLESSRLQVWPMLLRAASMSPWHGYGWLQVGAAQLAVVNDHPPINELWLHGHNLFLELVLWCGYPLGVALIALIVYWYVTRALKVRTTEAVVAMLFVSIFGLHALLELPHHYLYFLIPVGLWIGQVEVEVGSRSVVPAGFSVAPFGAGLFIAAALLWNYPEVEEDLRLVRFENMRIGSAPAARPPPDAPFLSSLTGFLRFARTTPGPGMTPEALAQMQAVAKRYPYSASLARLATAWAQNGRLDEARRTFLTIRQLHGEPTYLRHKRELGERVQEGRTGLAPLYNALP